VSRAPNNRLLAARLAAGLTQEQLAELANRHVERDSGRPGAMVADYISKLERGIHTWPCKHYRRALRAVFGLSTDADLGFYCTRSRATTVASNPQASNGGDDVHRQAFLRALAGSITGTVFSDPIGDVLTARPHASPRSVGPADVAHIRHTSRMFADQDHIFGGLSVHAALAQLSSSTKLLEASCPSHAASCDLYSAVGELADTAAGMCFDAGSHHQAEHCFRLAVGCATEAQDWSLRAKALSGMANLAVHQARTDDAISFSELALVRLDRLTPLVRAVVHTRHARALSMVGQARQDDCAAAIGRAEECFAQRNGSEPEWISYYDRARLDRDCGRALLELALQGGEYDGACQRLSAAVSTFPNAHFRGRALAATNLAVLMMTRDDPAYAASVGHQALDMVGALRSDRVLDGLRRLRGVCRCRKQSTHARELGQRLDAFLRSV
jgi:transcriptional regulator with XRE-family HTH domain